MPEKKKQTADEFMQTHPEEEWPLFFRPAKEEADKMGITVQEWLDMTRNPEYLDRLTSEEIE